MQVLLMETSKLGELVNRAIVDGFKYVAVRSMSELTVGSDPLKPTHVIDFQSETIYKISGKDPDDKPPAVEHALIKGVRRTGRYSVTVKEEEIHCTSLKELLANGLKMIEQVRPGTLERLSHKKPRSKRIVARDPKELFEQERLAARFSELLIDGWWYGTNNSKNETRIWLKRAAELADLKWGAEIIIKT